MRPRMPIAGQLIEPGRTNVTHNGDWDTTLVRIGHFLWKQHKLNPFDSPLRTALEDVWRVKREYRAPMIAARAAAREQRAQVLKRRA